ncbi:hypothetical protein F4778DRAFT_772513 [Xylariomycetidae sp. FL2044]|nr:hypothetical protein F4778DRAFT_772513 [Xylariomycetidae sp. FL2044]
MGIPAAFRWLSTKYPKIISPVIEDQPIEMEDGTVIPVDTTRPNPNGEEFDNLYLDMNGIVHPCSHPEDKPAPKDEEEMMVEIFKYTDRVVNMVRPRKLLMIAIDGVAPRAKMNQQRSRRFRSAQEAKEKQADKEELYKMLKQQNGGALPPETLEAMAKKAFDSNVITPGTPFMDILALSLRYWCAYKLNTDPGWAKMKVIISDATVPGEGEHKIMNFIRSQRASPQHDPNTRHVIYGLDADLIMLGLATHEPHFRVLREDVFAQQGKTRTCKICGQKGHDAQNCRGEAKEKEGEFDEKDKAAPLKPFIWLHVSIFREYLNVELDVPGLPFRFDLERAIDDWVFMCSFVGNDFLPHLPALEIRENGIDTLTAIWRDNLPFMGGYVTKDGHVDLERAQFILNGLAKQEDAIFKRRKETEDRREAGFKRRKLQHEQRDQRFARNSNHGNGNNESGMPSGLPPALTHDMVINRGAGAQDANTANKSAAAVLKNQIQGLMPKPQLHGTESNGGIDNSQAQTPASALGKRKAEVMEKDGASTPGTSSAADEAPEDTVRLWEDGYADRYYEQKFHVDPKDIEFRRKVARAYVEGLCWVLRYYYQGCPSWEWFYPYHYAPFAQDFVDIGKTEISFEKGRTAKPFEQLMSVQPAASRHSVLPAVFHDLMTDPDSPIIDFYPEEFEIDLNGKKMAWQGVALLPFIEMPRLLAAVEARYPQLSAADAARNGVGREVLLLSEANQDLYDSITSQFYSKKQGAPDHKLDPSLSQGLSGKVEKMSDYLPHGSLEYPLERKAMPDLDDDRSLTVHYEMPPNTHGHKSMLLRGVQLPPPTLNRSDVEEMRGKMRNSGRSHGGAPLGRQSYDGNRRERMNFGPDSRGGRNQGPSSYHNSSSRFNGSNSYPVPPPIPPPGWVPPPPNMAGMYSNGIPPPPPPAYVGNGGRDSYGYGQGYRGGYGGGGYGVNQGYNGNQGHGGQRGPPPPSNYGGQYDYGRPPPGHDGVAVFANRSLAQLPHRSGTSSQDLKQDDIANITRATLVKISASSIGLVLESLVSLLEELSRPYKSFSTYPSHVLLSEVYTLSLAADCCATHNKALRIGSNGYGSGKPGSGPRSPEPLEKGLVTRVFDHLKFILDPLPDGYILSARTVLDEIAAQGIPDDPPGESQSPVTSSDGSADFHDTKTLHDHEVEDVEPFVKTIVQFVSASTWAAAFEYIRNVIFSIRTNAPPQAGMVPTPAMAEEERASLVILRFLSYLWVDDQKLGMVLQELCSSFLHFRRAHQGTVAVVAPLLIARWIDRYPEQFVKLHNQHKKLEGGPDTLFDMTLTIVDSGKRRPILYPLQTALLMLIPDVFEVASNLRDAKSGSMAKKVAFLEGLRKGLRNKNETSAFCLIMLLRFARHFDDDGDATIVGYAMDVQDEVRDAVFRRYHPNGDNILFEQDLTTAALIALMHLNFESYVETLTQSCLSPSSPQTMKVAIVQACSYFARQPNPEDFRRLFLEAASFIQGQLKAMSAISADMYIGDRHSQRKASETNTSTSALICNILRFLDAAPMTLFEGPPPEGPDKFYEENFEAFVSCLVTANDNVRALASGLAKKLLAHDGILHVLRKSKCLDAHGFKFKFWRLTSLVLMEMCEKHEQQEDDTVLRSIHGYLESRLLLLSSVQELSDVTEDVPERTATSTKLETILLLGLCSPDSETCQLVTSCIGLFHDECHILDESKNGSHSLRNSEIFSEIASRGFRFTGMMAFQKRNRVLLRRMQYPSVGILDAWERAFDKWIHLSKDVSSTPVDNVDERSFSEWRNLSGFLASLGGICTAEQGYILDDTAISGLKWIDRLSSEHHEEPLLHRYLRLSTQLLACSNVRVRETIREVLSTEISPSLYNPLFKALESELEVLFTGALEASGKGQDGEIIFAEQAASLLKALVERLETPSEMGAASSVHFSSLCLSFAKFLDGVTDNIASLRVKIKICQLCESVTRKKEHLNLRDDIRKRNQLLEYIFSWIARPRSPRTESAYAPVRPDEPTRVQKDLDKACLRCLAELTYRLPLQPGDGQTDAGTSELKSQMFHTYFNRFLSLLNREPPDSMRGDLMAPSANRDEASTTSELAIIILSNLLSANIDVGLKHSLSIGYHENVEIRTAFVKVLYNILVQGTELNNLSDEAVNEKYDELLELLTNDMSLVISISSVCPSGEVEELTISLLNIFESRGLTFDLMEGLIKQEIEETENESEILRRNCVATKLLSIYAKWKGADYLKATLQKVVERLMLTSKDLDLELDPTRISSQEELKRNALQLRIVAKVFVDDISASSANIPPSFRKICSIIAAAVMPRFQEAKYTAVGAFIFLRFFCPAIVAPEAERLVNTPPSKEMRRGLLLIAKVIQNLANNVLFGAKEPYMYPLNDFLTQNIYKVTTFLREISVPPSTIDPPGAEDEAFDFGSCVSLHRFLYDHWDHVRQKLTSQERREQIRSPNELARGRTPLLEPLRTLITNLGPPPLAITWNRPQISANNPILYSRFQHFMLRNAFRSTDSVLTARAVYDGGESKDGLDIICIILRNIDQDSIDIHTLVFCFMKIASRLWHKPFGLLVDGTCYSGQHETSDELFRLLDALMPSEMCQQLTRVYVYNMNSAHRKWFRRLLRFSTKNEISALNPANSEYYFLGSLQDLQTHFHLSQLHLPKETISVVTDTRFVFQPITRNSKTKGRIEVVIKVGSQFVQVTTVRKQEIHPTFRLSAIVNDIFRLGDVDEVPVSRQEGRQDDDDSTFALRADNGKIVMQFTSPKKLDVLQAIRGAKAKYGKDTRILKSFERLIRPQDVPGTLLNLALTNLAAPDPVLRIASYNLLGALCKAFKFKAASKFMCIKDVSVPLDPTQFIVNISKTLACEEPQLTSDFLNEFFVGWESFSDEQKPLSLVYMAPWLPSLRVSLLKEETDSEKGKEKIALIFRKLIDVVVMDPTLALPLEYTVWPAIYKDETLLDIFLEEIIKAALAVGLYDERTQALTSVITAIGTITLRGKIISRLRKALNRSSLRPTKFLPENAVWNEVCILLQFCLSLSFDCGVQSQLYLPEIFHIVTMLANTGPYDVRTLIHRLLINSIHAACTSFKLDDARLSKLRGTLEFLAEPKNDIFTAPAVVTRDGMSAITSNDPGTNLAATESLAGLLFETCSVAAPSVDMANAWRSRWMSLVASTAFQNNPAIQPRAFTVMGCLAREEVDDDLLYQVLVALRSSINRFGDDSGTDMLIAIVSALSKMISKLTSASRYGLQLFWLAMSLIRLVPGNLFNCTAHLLEAVLTNIGTSKELRSEKMAQILLQGRAQLEEAALPLDEAHGVHFSQENFHFAVCACLVRGLTDPLTKGPSLRVLSTFLEMTTDSTPKTESRDFSAQFYSSPYLALVQARCATLEDLRECLWSAGISPVHVANISETRSLQDIEAMKDKDVLLSTAIELVDFAALEDSIQTHTMSWLSELAFERPTVVLHLCPTIASLLDDILLHVQNTATLEAAHNLLKTLSSNARFTTALDGSAGILDDILGDMGFEGLMRPPSLGRQTPDHEQDRQCFALTEKLIEGFVLIGL